MCSKIALDLRPQQDSNLRTRLRRPLLYPLSYGGWRNTRISLPAGVPYNASLPDRSQRTRTVTGTLKSRSARSGPHELPGAGSLAP